MAGEKIGAAQGALDRFLYQVLDLQDEIFLYRFNERPLLLQSWTTDRQLLSRARRGPIPIPSPFPPGGRRGRPIPPQPRPIPPPPSRIWGQGCSDPVDVGALREMTDDSGGRTVIVRGPADLEAATAGIADELSKQC